MSENNRSPADVQHGSNPIRKMIENLKSESRLMFHPAVYLRFQNKIFQFSRRFELKGAKRTG